MFFKSTIEPKKRQRTLFKPWPLPEVIDITDRDKTQSKRLHAPTSITSHTDPITGNDVLAKTHPFVIDGIQNTYFKGK